MSQTTVELQPVQETAREDGYGSSNSQGEALTGGTEFQSLPPVDRGKEAWLFLAASFMVEALTWGKILTYTPQLASIANCQRLPICIWCFPGLLQYQCSLQRVVCHRRHRYLRHGKSITFPPASLNLTSTGNHVSRDSLRHGHPETLPSVQSLVSGHRPIHHVHCPGFELLLPEHHAPYPYPGSTIRNWRLNFVLPVHFIHGRVVRQAQGLCLWRHVVGHWTRRVCSAAAV